MKPTELRPSVYAFACRMEETLRRHDPNKGRHGWRNMNAPDLARFIDGECLEIRRVAQGTTKFTESQADVFCGELVDLANYLMMVSEALGQLNVEGAARELKTYAASAVQPPPGISTALWTVLLNHRE